MKDSSYILQFHVKKTATRSRSRNSQGFWKKIDDRLFPWACQAKCRGVVILMNMFRVSNITKSMKIEFFSKIIPKKNEYSHGHVKE